MGVLIILLLMQVLHFSEMTLGCVLFVFSTTCSYAFSIQLYQWMLLGYNYPKSDVLKEKKCKIDNNRNFHVDKSFNLQERDNMQKSEFLKALSDMWKDFDARVLRYKV